MSTVPRVQYRTVEKLLLLSLIMYLQVQYSTVYVVVDTVRYHIYASSERSSVAATMPKYNSAAREEARFRKAEWDNYLRHGPRGQAEYHHGFEHCI